jgi:hypothetical protein
MLRDLEEMMAERGIGVERSTIGRFRSGLGRFSTGLTPAGQQVLTLWAICKVVNYLAASNDSLGNNG